MLVHATTVALAGQGILLLGPSGAGKSQLAFRLIQRGAWLVADDQTVLSGVDDEIWSSCPASIEGKLEVRGIGIVTAPNQSHAPVRLVLALAPLAEVVRLPEIRRWPAPLGMENTRPIPCVPFDAFRLDAAEAVIAALAHSRNWEDSPRL